MLLTTAMLPILVFVYGNKSKYSEMFFKMNLLFILFTFVQAQFLISYRLINYIALVLVASATNFLYDKSIKNNKRNIFLFFLFIFIAYRLYDFYKPSELEFRSTVNYDCRYIPYKTIFEEPDETREALFRDL